MLDREIAAKIQSKLDEISELIDEHTGPHSGKVPVVPVVPVLPRPIPQPVTPTPDPARNPYGSIQAGGVVNPYGPPIAPPRVTVVGGPVASNVSKGSRVLAHARKQAGKPYQWGGTGNPSFDCSGLTQWAYRQEGIEIGRTTYDQIKNGREIPFEEAQDGDLIFSRFSAPGRPEHVSINIAGPDRVFEAGDPIGEYNWADRGDVIVKRYV